MAIKDIKGTDAASASLSPIEAAAAAELAAAMPVQISDEVFHAAVRRGGDEAHELYTKLDGCRRRGSRMRDSDVESYIRRGSRHGRMNDDQAVVMAYYAQKHR